MKFFEKTLSRLAVPGLIRFVVALNAVVFLFVSLEPRFLELLTLDRAAILRGEVWRILSWMFIPGETGTLWVFLYLWFLWWVGDLLEMTWGTVRLNAYYATGALLCIGSALLFGASFGSLFLNLSLFFALATLLPDLEVLVFFVLPVKIKWMALFGLLAPALSLLFGSLPEKAMVIMCLGNYLLFFGPAFFRRGAETRNVHARRAKFEGAKDQAPTLHSCAVCGITESTDPDAEFRVASDGREYCTAHLWGPPSASEPGATPGLPPGR